MARIVSVRTLLGMPRVCRGHVVTFVNTLFNHISNQVTATTNIIDTLMMLLSIIMMLLINTLVRVYGIR